MKCTVTGRFADEDLESRFSVTTTDNTIHLHITDLEREDATTYGFQMGLEFENINLIVYGKQLLPQTWYNIGLVLHVDYL